MRKLEVDIKKINRVNQLGLNILRGSKNGRWNGGNRLKNNYPCPSCNEARICEKRDSHRVCRKCSYKNRPLREFSTGKVTRTAYYCRARRIVERSGVILHPYNHVHHINGDWTDNRLENLLVTTKWEHRRKYHNRASLSYS